MNTEEKAKAYDKALEKARIYYDNAKAVKEYAAVARYENIFPELHEEEKPLTPFQQCLSHILYKVYYASAPGRVDKFIMGIIRRYTDELVESAKKHEYTDCKLRESEDERIRKVLIRIVKGACSKYGVKYRGDEITEEILLSYLEKQKGQKIVYEDEYQRMLSDSYNCGKDEVISNPEKYGLQKKQKPTDLSEMMVHKEPYIAPVPVPMVADGQKQEWGEEDEEMINTLVDYVKYPSCWNLKCPKEKLVAFIKSLPKRFSPQPKQEWSEEEEQMFGNILNHYSLIESPTDGNGISKERYLAFIKSFRPQPKQEWSEEDERMLSRCEKSIESSKQFADSDTFKKAKDNEIDWLENRFKSLRPSWKPSEEQMKALRETIDFAPETFKPKCTLESLYNDLKKLI